MHSWQPIIRQYDELRAALTNIPAGSRVIAFRHIEQIVPSLQVGPAALYWQLPGLVVAERDAYLPFLAKNPMMPVAAAPRVRMIDTQEGQTVRLPRMIDGADPTLGPAMLGKRDSFGVFNFWGDWPNQYDYAIEFNFGAPLAFPSLLQPVAKGSYFVISKVVR
jgi:hypothetical protein